MSYQPTIGLEIHIELKTKTKMFCGCLNSPDEKQLNKNVCPICLAHPGTLPVINKKAVESVLKLGLALNGEIPEISKFDRKNYFYPDLPKGYQISQYDKPLCVGGELDGVKIRRIHLEEDTGKLIHSSDGKSSLVDFNRAGIPLMELVTEPEIKSGKEAVVFAKELQLILRYLGISDADMEKGQMRIEANVSISKDHKLGTKVEVKNLNSFRSVGEAIDYEIKRQEEVLEGGHIVKHETRGWDEFEKKTKSQRAKEEAHDYRYFPEPDLPPLDLTSAGGFDLEKLKAEIPELPHQKRSRFQKEYNLTPEQVRVLIEEMPMADYFENAASELRTFLPTADYRLLYNYFTTDVRGLIKDKKFDIKELKITPENLAHFIALIIKHNLTSRMAKDVLKEMFEKGIDPEDIIKERKFDESLDEETLNKAVGEVIRENPKAVSDYKNGQENALQFLIGQAMKKLKGQGNPDILRKLFEDYLSK